MEAGAGTATPDGGEPAEGEPFLRWLRPDELHDLRSRAVTRRFPRGTILFHEGDVSGRVLVLTEGRVKVSVLSEEGREVVLSFSGSGELFGEISAVDRLPRSATVTALEASEALALAAGDFERFLEAHPRVALVLLRVLAARLRDADRERMELAVYDTIRRVARRLLDLADRFGEPTPEGVTITLPLTQEELAGWIGSSREAVSKALQTLRTLDCIETQRRRITVLNLEALRRLAA
jgi:CRP/FNR family transcriptional regulator, cyclic AMP receptor protein